MLVILVKNLLLAVVSNRYLSIKTSFRKSICDRNVKKCLNHGSQYGKQNKIFKLQNIYRVIQLRLKSIVP